MMRKAGLFLLLTAIVVPALTFRLGVYPGPWIDEGYRTHAARLLMEHGRYGTETTDGFVAFDPLLSSGPLDIVAIGLSTKLFGRGIATARWATVCFGLIAIVSLFVLAAETYGEIAAFLITLFVVAAPSVASISFILINRQTIGEGPALAMLALGACLLLRARRRDSLVLAIAAGAALGTVFLCKQQVGISVVVALALQQFAAWRRGDARHCDAPCLAVALSLIATWLAWQWWGTSADARIDNLATLRMLASANVVTDLHGRVLSRSAIFMLAIITTAVLATYARQHTRTTTLDAAAASTERFLALACLISAAWIALLSVGWPRYLFVPYVLSLYLLAAALWDIVQRRRALMSASWHRIAVATATGVLIAIFLIAHVRPMIAFEDQQRTADTAAFIDRAIPRAAVIETWEWELDGLTHHWRFHHPEPSYFIRAIWQFGHGEPFALRYDPLAGNPDYVIEGIFSDWTGLYDSKIITANFDHVQDIGTYRVYRRRRM